MQNSSPRQQTTVVAPAYFQRRILVDFAMLVLHSESTRDLNPAENSGMGAEFRINTCSGRTGSGRFRLRLDMVFTGGIDSYSSSHRARSRRRLFPRLTFCRRFFELNDGLQTTLQLLHRISISAGDGVLRFPQHIGDFRKCQVFPVFQNNNFVLRFRKSSQNPLNSVCRFFALSQKLGRILTTLRVHFSKTACSAFLDDSQSLISDSSKPT